MNLDRGSRLITIMFLLSNSSISISMHDILSNNSNRDINYNRNYPFVLNISYNFTLLPILSKHILGIKIKYFHKHDSKIPSV